MLIKILDLSMICVHISAQRLNSAVSICRCGIYKIDIIRHRADFGEQLLDMYIRSETPDLACTCIRINWSIMGVCRYQWPSSELHGIVFTTTSAHSRSRTWAR